MAQIEKRGSSYRISVFNGRRPDGTRIMERTTWHPDPDRAPKQNEKDLQLFALEFEKKVKSGNLLKGEKLTVSQFAEIWLQDHVQKTMEQATISQYTHLLREHILPIIGKVKMADVKPKHIIDMLSELSENRKDGKKGGYSSKTLKHCKEICSSMFNTGINWGIIIRNPCDHVAIPKVASGKEGKDNFFTPEQTNIFLDYLEKDYKTTVGTHDRIHQNGRQYHVAEYTETHSVPTQLKLFYHLCVYGGFRRGELIGLTWDHVDLAKGTISVVQSTVQVSGKRITKEPKSRNSRRSVKLPAEISAMFKEYRQEYLEYRLAVGSFWKGDGSFVFIQANGLQMHPDTPTKAMKKIIRRYNADHPADPLPEITLHGLRHTSATLSIYSGADPEAVSKRLGHSRTSTTMDIYASSFEKAEAEAGEGIARVLGRG